MQEREIITTNQFVWMLFILITSITSMQLPAMLIAQAGRDAWLSVLGGWLLDVLLAVIYAYMGLRFPGENFVQYSSTILGKRAGKLVGVLFPLFFLVVCTIIMRGFGQLIIDFFLPTAPLAAILLSSLFVAAYAARQGLEVIVRNSELLGPLYIFSILIVALLITPDVEVNLLKPQFDYGVRPFLTGAPFILTYFGICIMMSMFIPLCNRPENGFVAKFISVSLGAAFSIIMVVLAVAVFGYKQAENMYAPGLELSRMISIGRYLERVEIIWVMLVIGAGIIASACMLWAFSVGIAQLAGLRTYKPLVYPTALLAMMLGLTSFHSSMEQTRFAEYTYPVFAAFIEAGLEIFLFITALIFNKRGKSTLH
ncbi:spore germination gerab [Lucifera butyrica]|uniref:Spore germination gerab n=1 Tax=Lucifera butyrica TaxID=1351585 RepID=A0A498QY89_9FIRM|nr:endospore germination permease [Lucifera butyrica]VBB05146.1 spore germination gerab [Lucifera butyrica]